MSIADRTKFSRQGRLRVAVVGKGPSAASRKLSYSLSECHFEHNGSCGKCYHCSSRNTNGLSLQQNVWPENCSCLLYKFRVQKSISACNFDGTGFHRLMPRVETFTAALTLQPSANVVGARCFCTFCSRCPSQGLPLASGRPSCGLRGRTPAVDLLRFADENVSKLNFSTTESAMS